MTRIWNIVNDNSNANATHENTFNTEVLNSYLCDYNGASILVEGDITIIEGHATQVAFKNCVPFTKCITKIDGTTVDNSQDLDLVMSMYNLIKYSSKYSERTKSLWFYSKEKSK